VNVAKSNAQAQRDWRARHPDKSKNHELKKRFGISFQQYEEMWLAQDGLCAICGKAETAKRNGSDQVRYLAVDHCHATGKIRALLCTGCNQGLGNFREDAELLVKAAAYLMGK
jgi:hypothetical protein